VMERMEPYRLSNATAMSPAVSSAMSSRRGGAPTPGSCGADSLRGADRGSGFGEGCPLCPSTPGSSADKCFPELTARRAVAPADPMFFRSFRRLIRLLILSPHV
jgi:hypothetical protein